jgi:hypothetical protein
MVVSGGEHLTKARGAYTKPPRVDRDASDQRTKNVSAETHGCHARRFLSTVHREVTGEPPVSRYRT